MIYSDADGGTGFVELQTDKRNTYRKKVAADKASGKVGSPPPGEEESYIEGESYVEGQLDRDGQPAAKKARMDESGIAREGDIPDMHREEEAGEEDEGGEEPDDEDDEEGDEVEDRQETEEQIEEPEQHEADDEALDNGEDSD